MRKRVLEIHSEMGGEGHGGGGSTRERELADMVLRLTSSSSGPSDSAQLAIQADTISRLLAQRDFLIRGAEEERARWEAEREGWHRTAEALIAARGGSRTGSSATREELEKKRTWLESDNKALRFKLQDTQERLTTLESELSKLKPILLMQPFPTAATHTLASLNHSAAFLSSIPYPSVRGSGKMIHKSSGRRKIKTTLATGDGTSTDSLQPIANPNTGDHYRKPEVPQTLPSASTEVPSPSKKSHHPNAPLSAKKTPQTPPALPSLPLASDARAEHLLLAARKIGRERTSIVAGIVRVRQQELERERIERERAEREKDRAEREMERLERLKSGVSYYRKEGETNRLKRRSEFLCNGFNHPIGDRHRNWTLKKMQINCRHQLLLVLRTRVMYLGVPWSRGKIRYMDKSTRLQGRWFQTRRRTRRHPLIHFGMPHKA
ncbi:hypothetical protein BD779DRAFT_659966 [Infundibulicybe gibba]|nr:hypothetical protein BD779DRAFT_659966 [Infundibulicybe gibba]